MNKNKIYVLTMLLMPLNQVMALEPLDDQTLSTTTNVVPLIRPLNSVL